MDFSFAPAAMLTGGVLLGASLLAATARAAELKVFSSPAASAALLEVAPPFERRTGHKVVLEFANIAAQKKKIAAGENFDIAIVSPKLIEELVQAGKIAAGTPYGIGRTGLAVTTRKGAARPDIGSVEAFKRSLLGARAVYYSATGESGIGFMTVLDRLGIAAEMKPRIHPQANLTGAMETGDADFGISGVGAALANGARIDFVGPVPAGVQAYVNLAAGVNANSREPQAARDLLQYLSDPSVAQIMKARGLEPY